MSLGHLGTRGRVVGGGGGGGGLIVYVSIPVLGFRVTQLDWNTMGLGHLGTRGVGGGGGDFRVTQLNWNTMDGGRGGWGGNCVCVSARLRVRV